MKGKFTNVSEWNNKTNFMIYFYGYDSSAIAALYVQMYVLMNASMYVSMYIYFIT